MWTGQELDLTETVFFLAWVLQEVYSRWPLGSHIAVLTFCGLNSKSRNI